MGGTFVHSKKQDYFYCRSNDSCAPSCDTKSFSKLTCGNPRELRRCSAKNKKLDHLLCEHVYKGTWKSRADARTKRFGKSQNPFWVCVRKPKCKPECQDKSVYSDLTCNEKTKLPCMAQYDEVFQHRCQSLGGKYSSGMRKSSVLGRKKFFNSCTSKCSRWSRSSFAEIDASVASESEERVEVKADGTAGLGGKTPFQKLMNQKKFRVDVQKKLGELKTDLEVKILFVFWSRYVLEIALLEHLFFSEDSKWWSKDGSKGDGIMALPSLDQCASIPHEEYGEMSAKNDYDVSGNYRLESQLLCTLGKAISRLPRLDTSCATMEEKRSDECSAIRMLRNTFRPGQNPESGGKSVLEEMKELQCIGKGKECVPRAYKHKMKNCVLNMVKCMKKHLTRKKALRNCEICREYPITQATQTFDMDPEQRKKKGYILPWDAGFDNTPAPTDHAPIAGTKYEILRILPVNRFLTSRGSEKFQMPHSRKQDTNYFLSSTNKDQTDRWASQSYEKNPHEERQSYIPAKFFFEQGEESAPTKGKTKETVVNWIIPQWTANVLPQLTEMFVQQGRTMRGRENAAMEPGSKQHVAWLKKEFLAFVNKLQTPATQKIIKEDWDRAFGVLNAQQAKKVNC